MNMLSRNSSVYKIIERELFAELEIDGGSEYYRLSDIDDLSLTENSLLEEVMGKIAKLELRANTLRDSLVRIEESKRQFNDRLSEFFLKDGITLND